MSAVRLSQQAGVGAQPGGESSRRCCQDDSDSSDHNHDLLCWILIQHYTTSLVSHRKPHCFDWKMIYRVPSSARCRHQLLVIADYFNKHARNDFCRLTKSQTSSIDETVIYWIWLMDELLRTHKYTLVWSIGYCYGYTWIAQFITNCAESIIEYALCFKIHSEYWNKMHFIRMVTWDDRPSRTLTSNVYLHSTSYVWLALSDKLKIALLLYLKS